jgi:6-phosphogluconolactonase (cycloisomerase 2 family)
MIARIVWILAFALLADCGGGGEGSGGAPETPSKFLYASAVGGPNSFPTDIYGFAVYPGGALNLVPGSPAGSLDFGGGQFAITRDSKLLYTNNFDELTAFQINTDGSLTNAPSPSLSLPDTPVGLVAHPTADFLYASSSPGALSVFAINSETAALNLTSSVSLASNNVPIGNPVITPDGRYLYQYDLYYPNSVGQSPALLQFAGFSIDSATGALSAVPGSPVSPITPATSYVSNGQIAVDPTGKFLYASYETGVNVAQGGGVVAFSIDASSGALTAVPGSPFSVGGVPNSVATDASGKFLIVSISPLPGGAPANCLAVLSIDPGTGALASVPGSPFGPLQSCGAVAADPSLAFVYAGTTSDALPGAAPAAIFVLSVDQTTGALAAIGQAGPGNPSYFSVSSIALTH